MLSRFRVTLPQSLEGFHGTEVFNISGLQVDLNHGRVIAVVEKPEESFARGKKQVTHDLVHLTIFRAKARDER